ncbi:GNAT family N-acetyltransferase [Pseudaquabacterium terrae]|nr:GNAT family N-acetyltransferase [Aquabacterium terrae]
MACMSNGRSSPVNVIRAEVRDDFLFTFRGREAIGIRVLDPGVDAAHLHDWFNRDYARFWGMQHKSLEEVRTRLIKMLQRSDRELLMGVRLSTGERLFMLECYRPESDALGRYYAVQPADRGFHLIVAPPRHERVPDLTYFVMLALSGYLFRDPAVRRIVAEPDIRNHKMLVRCAQAGYELGKALYLPHKTARLISLTRERFAQLDCARAPPKPQLPPRAPLVSLHMTMGKLATLLVRVGGKLRLIKR